MSSFFLGLQPTDWRYVFVADFEALSCQVTRKFIRCRNAQIPTISAIKYTACYKLAFFLFKRHTIIIINQFCHSVIVRRVCVCKVLFFKEGGDFLFFLRVGKSILFCKLWFVSGLVRLANVYALWVGFIFTISPLK